MTPTPQDHKPKKFLVKKRLDLGFLGEDWARCYINFAPAVQADLKEIQSWNVGTEKIDPGERDPEKVKKALEGANKSSEHVVNFLKGKFIDGKGVVAGEDGKPETVDLSADDIGDIDMEVISKAMALLVKRPDPNSSAPSTPQSSTGAAQTTPTPQQQ